MGTEAPFTERRKVFVNDVFVAIMFGHDDMMDLLEADVLSVGCGGRRKPDWILMYN